MSAINLFCSSTWPSQNLKINHLHTHNSNTLYGRGRERISGSQAATTWGKAWGPSMIDKELKKYKYTFWCVFHYFENVLASRQPQSQSIALLVQVQVPCTPFLHRNIWKDFHQKSYWWNPNPALSFLDPFCQVIHICKYSTRPDSGRGMSLT